MLQTKINAYNNTIDLPIYSEMEKYYDIMADIHIDNLAPRIYIDNRIMFKDIVYYISILYKNNPGIIADIGAGACVWDQWFDNIFSFEPKPGDFSLEPDSRESFNNDFILKYNKSFDCGMAINSLHFIPYSEISQRIDDAMSVVKDRFLMTFNLKMLAKFSDIEYDYESGLKRLLDILHKTEYNILMLDFVESESVAGINGHVRIIYEHTSK